MRSGRSSPNRPRTTGSIGVIVPHYDISGLLERLDIKDDSIVSHPRKRLLSMTKPLTADDRQVLQIYMEEAFDRFKQIVKNGRPAFRDNEQALDELATGEIFSATQAQQNGLVDEIGFVEDAIDRAAELAGLDPQAVRVVSYKTPLSLLDVLRVGAVDHRHRHGLAIAAGAERAASVLLDDSHCRRSPPLRDRSSFAGRWVLCFSVRRGGRPGREVFSAFRSLSGDPAGPGGPIGTPAVRAAFTVRSTGGRPGSKARRCSDSLPGIRRRS